MPVYIVEKDMDIDALASSLARSPRAAAKVRDRILAANPHLEHLARVPKGGIVVIPPGTDIRTDAGTSTSGTNLEAFAGTLRDGLKDLDRRVTEHNDAQLSEHSALREALKGAAGKRLVEGDARLRKRLTAAEAQFKADQKQGTEARAQLAELTKAMQAEIARMQKAHG